MILRSVSVKITGGASVTVWSMPPAPTMTVVPPVRVDQMHDLDHRARRRPRRTRSRRRCRR